MGLSRGAQVYYAFTFGSILIFSIALLSTHTVFMKMFAGRSARIPPGVYNHTECTLAGVTVDQHGPNKWVAMWIATHPGVVTYSAAITSPFGYRSIHANAIMDSQSRALNATYECVCPNYSKFSGVDPIDNMEALPRACMLEVGIVRYLQTEGHWYKYAESTLVGVGVMAFLFALTGLFVLLWDTQCFWRCCQKVTNFTGYMRASDVETSKFDGGEL